MKHFTLKVRPFMEGDEAGYIEAAAWIAAGSHVLTHECRNVAELEYCVNGLKKELDSLLASARNRFKREQDRATKLLHLR
jgi:hypothetical protein